MLAPTSHLLMSSFKIAFIWRCRSLEWSLHLHWCKRIWTYDQSHHKILVCFHRTSHGQHSAPPFLLAWAPFSSIFQMRRVPYFTTHKYSQDWLRTSSRSPDIVLCLLMCLSPYTTHIGTISSNFAHVHLPPMELFNIESFPLPSIEIDWESKVIQGLPFSWCI